MIFENNEKSALKNIGLSARSFCLNISFSASYQKHDFEF